MSLPPFQKNSPAVTTWFWHFAVLRLPFGRRWWWRGSRDFKIGKIPFIMMMCWLKCMLCIYVYSVSPGVSHSTCIIVPGLMESSRGSWRVQNSMGKTGAGVLEINSMFTLKDTANVMEDLRYAAKFCSEIHRTRSFSGWRTYNCWCSDAFSLILKDRHDMHAWKKSRLVVFPAKRTISSNLRGGWTSLSFHQVERWYLLGWGTQRLEVGSVSDVRRA